MHRFKYLTGGTIAVVVAGVLAATALAAGPVWHVSGKVAPEKEAITTTGGPFVLKGKAKGAEIVIECEKVSSEEATITDESNADAAKSIVFSGKCAVTNEKACTVAEPIKTEPVTTTLLEAEVEKVKGVYDEFAPTTGTLFVKIKITKCALEGTYSVEGTARGRVTEPEKSQTSHNLEFTTATGSELLFDKEAATLVGTAKDTAAKEYSA